MHPALPLYKTLTLAAGLSVPVVGLGLSIAEKWNVIGSRAGLYRDLAPSSGPGLQVWLQAVSVGEVAVAQAVCQELFSLKPDISLTITSSTSKGLEKAWQDFAGKARVAAYPLDLPWPIRAIYQKIKPDVYVSLETEIWPYLLDYMHHKGTACLLLNGRLSPRSFPRYKRVKPLVKAALSCFSLLSMISQDDAERICALGADPSRVLVEGNAKYAGLLAKADKSITAQPASILNLDSAPLLVAGSVRGGEESHVLGAFKRIRRQFPSAVLALVPRHVETRRQWHAAALKQGLSVAYWTELSMAHPRPKHINVVLVDTMGCLMALYGLAQAAFVGASLVNKGGQNPMEPAAWGVPVFWGPSMDDFRDAEKALTTAGAGRMVKNQDELYEAWKHALSNPEKSLVMGAQGRQVVAYWSGAAAKAANHILRNLPPRKGK